MLSCVLVDSEGDKAIVWAAGRLPVWPDALAFAAMQFEVGGAARG